MHFEGTKSLGEAGHHENRGIMAAIEDLQHSQAAIWAKFQSLHQETTIPLAPQGGQGPQGSHYLTKEDIHAILFKDKKMESAVYVDTRPSYPKEIAGKPYPANYTPPIFPRYDCITGNAREHIRWYVDALTSHSHDQELRLREFSKSLEGRAFTWYTSLTPGSVLSWNDLATQFMKKFFALEEKLTLSDLQHEKQRVFKELLEYIHRFRDLSLLCYDPVGEERLVHVYIAGMLYQYQPYLEHLQISSFTRLVEATRRTSLSMRKPSKGLASQVVSAPRQP